MISTERLSSKIDLVTEKSARLSDRFGVGWVAFSIALMIFLPGAGWWGPDHIDPLTHAMAAWAIGTTGSPIMPDSQDLVDETNRGNLPWIVESPRGPVSQYPPGTALLAAPLSAVWPGDGAVLYVSGGTRPDAPPVAMFYPPRTPSIIVAVLCSAAAVGVLAQLLLAIGATQRQALAGALIGGLGTSLWGVASQELWHHGPAALALSLALLAAAKERFWWSGAAFGAGILIRPHVALIAASVGIVVSLSRRSWRPVVAIGANAALGAFALIAYNYWLWQRVTVFGGYGAGFGTNLASNDVSAFAWNLFRAFFDPIRGLFVVSPMTAILVVATIAAWRRLPDLARGGAIGALIFTLVQFKANRYSGGGGFMGYRYFIEPLVALAPAFLVAWQMRVRGHERWGRYFTVLAILSMVPQLLAAIFD